MVFHSKKKSIIWYYNDGWATILKKKIGHQNNTNILIILDAEPRKLWFYDMIIYNITILSLKH